MAVTRSTKKLDEAEAPQIPLAMLAMWAVLCYAAYANIGFAFSDEPPEPTAPNPLVSATTLAIVRGLLCLVHAHRIILIVGFRPKYEIDLVYQPDSKFAGGKRYVIGVQRLVTFTVQTWTLHGLYYGLATLALVAPDACPLRLTGYLFELSFAAAHLVSFVTTYVLVPSNCEKWRGPIAKVPILGRDQIWLHNANVAAIHVDMLLSGQRLVMGHWALSLAWGVYYVAFAWARARWICGWVPYFFLDYSVAVWKGYAFHLGLAFFQILFFLGSAAVMDKVVELELSYRVLLHAAIIASAMRLRPPAKYR